MYNQYADFEVEGVVRVEGVNLPRLAGSAKEADSVLLRMEGEYCGPFAPLLIEQLNQKTDDDLFVIVVSEKAEGSQFEVSGWLILKYVGDLKLQSCGFMNNSEEAFWQLSRRMEMYTGTPITPVLDTSEPLDKPAALDFRG